MMQNRTTDEIRQLFLDFYKEKGHAILPSASIIPENDPTVLFTTAGMQPLVPYLLGEKHPMGTRLANAQKCLRTDDIDEVGDNTHGTFFEMLGNWSLGDYFKEEAIGWSYEFLTKPEYCGIEPTKLYVTVFEGDADAPRDEESANIWQAQFAVHGIQAEIGEAGVDEPAQGSKGPRIYTYPKKKNWWGPAGQTGPCGPDTEMFYDTGKPHKETFGPVCHPNCDCGRFVEIWNDVFMQYNKQEDGSFAPLEQKNVDTGMGLERMAAVLQQVPSNYDTDAYSRLFSAFNTIFDIRYGVDAEIDKSLRIIMDHLRAVTFIVGDQNGVAPSNIGQGYIARRLLRRASREAKRLGIDTPIAPTICQEVINLYGDVYPELVDNAERILTEVKKEEDKFALTLEKGLKILQKIVEEKLEKWSDPKLKEITPENPNGFALNVINGYEAFDIYQTYGFPVELIQEELGRLGMEKRGVPFTFNVGEFREAERKHQQLSRTASAGVFKGGLQDQSEETTKLHTATHLLHQALREVLGTHVAQRGSNINADRLRFDFVHPEKMTDEQKQKVEEIVNSVIKKDLPVTMCELTVDEAKAQGAIGIFDDKYGNKVKVYTVEDPNNEKGFYSKEICGGPHVTSTGQLGGFKIKKEESVSAGIRRIKAVIG
ncbi:MAG: alanine--tRNA ligase [Patescibacteria group bacterium]|nr:alanine--tRNA ligase [Patescibacteria group bacterium]